MIAQHMTPEQMLAQVKTNSIGLINVAKKLRSISPTSPVEQFVREEFNATLDNLRSNLDALSAFFNEEL